MTRRDCLLLGAAAPWSIRGAEPTSLFDGKSLAGWNTGDGFEKITGWTIEDGAIVTIPGAPSATDLLTDQLFGNYELTFSVRLSRNANSGVKYFVNTGLRYLYGASGGKASSATGLEFQLADDAAPDCPKPVQKSGALYAMLPPAERVATGPGTWIQAKLVCRDFACEHWINGKRILTFDLTSPEMQARLRGAATDMGASVSSNFAASLALRWVAQKRNRGRIALQHHDTKVWFRDLKLVPL